MEFNMKFNVVCDFTQKEFSVMTRALAGHELKSHDLVLARELKEIVGIKVNKM